MTTEEKLDQLAEHLYRLREFRTWVQTNVLFPAVPDAIVHPLVDHLKQAEVTLVAVLYHNGGIGRVAALEKTLERVQ